MCGIAGITDPETPPTLDLLKAMAKPLEKRGPDDFGYYQNRHVGLVHQRLSIIDISGGHQPIFNEDKSLAIVFNGEIYDYKNLRQRLVKNGHQFTTQSDTEVLIHLFEDEGPNFLNLINGMFALAVYNCNNGELFIARDRLGQKPLFYSCHDSRFAFASGPSSLLPIDWIDQTINTRAIHDYLEYQYLPTPQSIFVSINKLEPGSYAVWNNRALQIHQFWRPHITGTYSLSYSDAKEELNNKLTTAVSKRLVADVPVGLFLSGGMDSSLICALAQNQLDQQAHTFSIGFPEKKFDERDFAKQVSDYLGTKHHFLEVKPNDFDHLKEIVSDCEEPFCDASILPTSLLSKFTKEYVTVALSGDGADEFFGGYYRYRIIHMCQWLTIVPKSVRKTLCAIILKILPPKKEERTFRGRIRRLVEINDCEGLQQYLKLISRCPASLKTSLYGEAMTQNSSLPDSLHVLERFETDTSSNSKFVEKIMEIDIQSYLNDDILVKVDRASMKYGLEVRSPFLDVDVAEFAMSLPYEWKQHGVTRKKILIDTFSKYLPAEIFHRPKMGFGVPIARWIRHEWKENVQSLLLSGSLVNKNLFNKEKLEELISIHLQEKADFSYTIFALLVLELWLEQKV